MARRLLPLLRSVGIVAIFLLAAAQPADLRAGGASTAGSISGRVTNSATGLGMPNVGLHFYDLNANLDGPSAIATTDANGDYTVNVANSDWGIITQNTVGFINKIYNNVPCSAVCDVNIITPVTVTNNAVTGIDFVLDPGGGRISGTVTSSATGLPIANIRVNFVDPGPNVVFTSGVTDTNGFYITDGGSATGNVWAFTENAQGYRNEAYNNVACANCDPTLVGSPIAVTLGQTTANVNFALDPGGSISGTVRNESLVPVAGVTVHLISSNGTHLDNIDTDGSGNYSFQGLPAGNYFLFTYNQQGLVDEVYNNINCFGGFCNAPAVGTPVAVTIGAVTSGVDFVLAAGGTITGTVTAAAGGLPIANANVAIFNASGTQVGGAWTDGAGGFSLAVPAGTYYAQTVNVSNYANQLYAGIPCSGCPVTSGTPIQVLLGQTTGNINFSLAAPGSITGTVTNAAGGAAIGSLSVQVLSSTGIALGTVQTNGSGVYSLGGLAAGSYYVRTTGGGAFINQLYNGVACQNCNVTTSGGTLVAVAAGATTSSINFSLTTGGRISGTITNAAGGAPIQNIAAQIFNASGVSLGQFNSNASGVYTTPGLPAGTYYVRTQNSLNFVNQLHSGVECPITGCVPTLGAPVTVTLGVTTSNINFALAGGGQISGTVTNAVGGAPIQSVPMLLYNALGRFLSNVSTNASGSYTFAGLPAGNYFIRTNDGLGFVPELYDDVPCVPFCNPTTGAPIGVTAGATTSGRDFVLTAGGSISGTVRNANTLQPIASVLVNVYTSTGLLARGLSTDANGNYTIPGLPAGTYYARSLNTLGYLDSVYNSKYLCAPSCLVTDGDPISVTTGNTTAGINLDLVPGTEMIQNGNFANGTTNWSLFATDGTSPDPSYLAYQLLNGTFSYYRVPPPSGSNSAVILQNTGQSVPANGPMLAQFDLANTSDVRKRISVLVHDGDFSDLSVCTFWLPPNSANRRYGMLTHTTKAWTNATISLYAASAGASGGFYQLDNVSLQALGTSVDRTGCIDPFAPGLGAGADGPELLTNGDFGNGTTSSWNIVFQMISQVAAGVFEFYRPSAAPNPAGVILQQTGVAASPGEILTAQFDLGNSSAVRKRVTVLMHDINFGDLSACTFWLEPSQALATYTMRSYVTAPWTSATLSIYAATVGDETWTRLDNASLRKTPGAAIPGTECFDPGVVPAGAAEGQAMTSASAASGGSTSRVDNGSGFAFLTEVVPGGGPGWVVEANATAPYTLTMATPVDLRQAASARLRFESRLIARDSTARVQVSVDGQTWQDLEAVPPSQDWVQLDIDLSPFAGQVIYLRFAFDAVAPMDGSAPDVWQIMGVTVDQTADRRLRMPMKR